MTVTKEAYAFAQKCALDGVVTKKNSVYLAHYAQVLMDGYEARMSEIVFVNSHTVDVLESRLAEDEATIDRLLTEREVMQRRITTLEYQLQTNSLYIEEIEKAGIEWRDECLRKEKRIAELERQLAQRQGVVRKPQPRLDAILQPAKLNVEPDGDVIYA